MDKAGGLRVGERKQVPGAEGGGQQQGHDVFGGGDEEGQFREPKQHFVFVGGEIIQIATSDKTHQHRDTGTAEGWHINQHARQHLKISKIEKNVSIDHTRNCIQT